MSRHAATKKILLLSSFSLFGLWAVQKNYTQSAHQISLLKTPETNSSNFEAIDKISQARAEFLFDSILSIVETYYVDVDRARPQILFKLLMKELASDFEKIDYVETEREAVVKIGNVDLKLNLNHATMEELLSDLNKLNKVMFLQKDVLFANGKPTPTESVIVNAMISSLDAHSSLLNSDSYRELRQGTEGAFGGLGVLVGVRDSILTVIKPLPHSPASRIGLQSDDMILSINHVETFGSPLDSLVDLMRGDPGTSVHLSILQKNGVQPKEMKLTREIVHVDSVTSRTIEIPHASILHLTIDSFSSRTSKEVLEALKRAKAKRSPIGGVVIDLRSNPGGLLDQAVQVADLFLKSGVIVSTKGRREEVERAGQGYEEFDYPIVVLTNSESASASEIVAGALQDHQRALIIGQQTFGKGSVQTIFDLPDEQALKLTIARYYTPSERSIQNIGITPDIYMQPILPQKTNENLFGRMHYFNEQSLAHHLETMEASFETLNTTKKKIFYIKNDNTDRDLNLATSIIKKINERYGVTLPEGAQRSTHWLELADLQIDQTADILEFESQKWLKNNFGVDWSTHKDSGFKHLVFSALDDKTLKMTAGEEKTLHWSLSNPSDLPINRLSVFFRSPDPSIETQEILVGKLAPRETRKGEIKITMPQMMTPGRKNLVLSPAIDGTPYYEKASEMTIIVGSRAYADIQLKGKIIQNNLTVDIENNSDIDIHDLNFRLHNLAGTSVLFEKDKNSLKSLKPRDRQTLVFPLKFKNQNRKTFKIGLSADSRDLKKTQFQTISNSQELAH